MIEQSTLHISGRDAFSFLQGQLTCDMREITAENHYAALCNNKGRVVASLEIRQDKNQDQYLINLPKTMMPIILKTLEKYAKFSNVDLLEETSINLTPIDLLSTIQNKIAIILPDISGLFTPHELNYHNLNFISFNKGCYIGQEIIARMQYLGKLKKQLCHLKLESITNLPEDIQIINMIKLSENHYEVLAIKKQGEMA